MLTYEPFVPFRDSKPHAAPKCHLRLAADRMTLVTKATAQRLQESTRMSVSELLIEVRHHGVRIDGLDQDGALSAANKALLEDGVSGEQLDCMTIADVVREIDRRALEVYVPVYTLEFYALWSRLDETDFIVVFRRGPNGMATLHDLAPRVKPQGSCWDWHGVVPPNRAFSQSRALCNVAELEDDDDLGFDDSVKPFRKEGPAPQWSHRFLALWREPGGKIKTQEVMCLDVGARVEDFLAEAKDLARGDSPTLGCMLLLKNRLGVTEQEWEVEPWIESGYVSNVKSIFPDLL